MRWLSTGYMLRDGPAAGQGNLSRAAGTSVLSRQYHGPAAAYGQVTLGDQDASLALPAHAGPVLPRYR
ncbi:MAG: hypothetical protein ACLP70_00285 [Streptosporangiaceae bacterium]